MTGRPVRIGIIDSGADVRLAERIAGWRSFTREDQISDHLGHGTRVADLVCEQAPGARLVIARVFGNRPTTRPAVIAEALDWLAAERVALINMSFGLAADRQLLAESCTRAGRAGTILVASAPARGLPCYPAAYPEVIAVTGDARCKRGETSHLDANAAFGTWCASPEQDAQARISGASIAAAHFSGLAADWLAAHPGSSRQAVVAHFIGNARFRGPERRTGTGRP